MKASRRDFLIAYVLAPAAQRLVAANTPALGADAPT